MQGLLPAQGLAPPAGGRGVERGFPPAVPAACGLPRQSAAPLGHEMVSAGDLHLATVQASAQSKMLSASVGGRRLLARRSAPAAAQALSHGWASLPAHSAALPGGPTRLLLGAGEHRRPAMLPPDPTRSAEAGQTWACTRREHSSERLGELCPGLHGRLLELLCATWPAQESGSGTRRPACAISLPLQGPLGHTRTASPAAWPSVPAARTACGAAPSAPAP